MTLGMKARWDDGMVVGRHESGMRLEMAMEVIPASMLVSFFFSFFFFFFPLFLVLIVSFSPMKRLSLDQSTSYAAHSLPTD